MRLFKLPALFFLGLSLGALLILSARFKKGTGKALESVNSNTKDNIDTSLNSSEETTEFTQPHAHQKGDARHDNEELKKNQAQLHVSPNHKTIEMEEHKRGTFP